MVEVFMVWVAFSYNSKTPICKISIRMNAEKYINPLEDILILFIKDHYENNGIFQQDNAAVHNSSGKS